jgi:hypothetical protein
VTRLSELSTIIRTSGDFETRKKVLNFDSAWSLCVQNREELYKIFSDVSEVANLEILESYDLATQEIYRRLINHLGTVFLLKELIMGENNHLKKIGREISEYGAVTEELFGKNSNSHFVVLLRNHVFHNSPFSVDIQSLMNSDHELVRSLVILDCKKLMELGNWDVLARKYIEDNSPYIDLKTCLDEYFSIQEKFYTWFMLQLNEKYDREISYCKTIEDEYMGLLAKEKAKVENMSFEEMSNLPRIELQGGFGFSINKVQ